MRAVADKRSLFVITELRALQRIDAHVPQRDRPGVRSLLVALGQVSVVEMAAETRVFEAARRLIMKTASIGESTLDKHMATLEQLGLVEVERRGATHGGGLPNRYALLDSPAPGAPLLDSTNRIEYPPVTNTGGSTDTAGLVDTPGQPLQEVGGHSIPPLRAHHNGVKKKKEEGEREGACADTSSESPVTGGEPDVEQAVVAELGALLAERGEHLSASDRFAIRGAVGAAPAGVDVAAAAARLRRNYGSGGKAEHRRIGAIGAVLVAEITQSSASAAVPEHKDRARRRDRTTTSAESATARAARIAKTLRIHTVRPALDPGDRWLNKAWEHVRRVLEEDLGGAWSWMSSIGLAGSYACLVDEAGGDTDQAQHVIVLQADSEQLEWIATNAVRCGVVRLLEDALVADGIVVELVPSTGSKAAAA